MQIYSNLITPAEIEQILKANSGTINIKPSPMTVGKVVIETQLDSNGEKRSVYMTKANSPSLREYADAQFAINALKKMGNRSGLDCISVNVAVSCNS
ncbi:hypothetical protein [Vibrio fluvialis]|uniref:hypothetical protein n=1 Tax=Vibrio fluvialis TaxID=676 RepID=UPI00192BD27A|nr:hypothetical protein [Vibrio fluvialis]MBL4262842.1 hypothetical protein [Vibrio fluvialis]